MPELPSQYDHDGDYGTYGTPDPVPAGEYTALILESEKKDNRAGTGAYIRLVMEITEGQYKGRKLFETMNLWHENPMTVRIAMAEMKSLCNACGGIRPQQTEELHSIPFLVKVGQRKREDTGEMQNSIKAFKAIGNHTPEAAAAGQEQTGTDKPPWKK